MVSGPKRSGGREREGLGLAKTALQPKCAVLQWRTHAVEIGMLLGGLWLEAQRVGVGSETGENILFA